MRDTDIRVACFADFRDYEDIFKKTQMWAHYADNHRGFCIEYDISAIEGAH